MRRLLVLALFAFPLALTATPAVVAEKPSDEAKKEYDKFEGTWKIESVEVGGKKQDDLKGTILTLKGNTFSMKEGDMIYKGTYKVDPTKKPKEIDVTVPDAPGGGGSMLGIYELEGDTYKVCFKLGKSRPTEFSSGKESDMQILEVLKRVKEKK